MILSDFYSTMDLCAFRLARLHSESQQEAQESVCCSYLQRITRFCGQVQVTISKNGKLPCPDVVVPLQDDSGAGFGMLSCRN